ncbi:MAG: hypothetical protein ABIN83_05680 [Sphingomicrobium sp.]
MVSNPNDRTRRRWINLGEFVAVVGLIISALALWNSWSKDDRPAVVIEHNKAIPLALRGKVEDDGKRLVISPIEPGHALESLTLSFPAKPPLDLGSEPVISASSIEPLLADGKKDGSGSITVTLAASYIEAGTDRRSSGRYRISFRWADGGLFGGHSLRLTAMTRA